MSKRLSIVLLTVTVLVAVWTFVSMLVVDPMNDEALSESVAEQAALLLVEDEDFLDGVSAKVEEAVPGYVAEWAESDAFRALLNDLKAQMVSETVAELMDGPMADVLADIALLRLGNEEGPVSKYAMERLTGKVAGTVDLLVQESLPDLEAEFLALYAKYGNSIAADVLARQDITDEVNALIAEAKEEPVDLESEVLALYAKYGKALAADILSHLDITDEVQAMIDESAIDVDELTASIIAQHDITAEVQAMIEDAKEEPVDLESEIFALYAKYGRALAKDILSQLDITAEVQAMIDESAIDVDELTASIIAQHDITAEVQAMIEDAKEEPVDLESEVFALYAKYGRALAADILSQLDITDEVQAMIDESAIDVDELTASIIAQHDTEVQAMIDANTASTLATVETMIEESQPDLEKEVLLLYDKYAKALANEIISKHVITNEVQAMINASLLDLQNEIVALDEQYGSENISGLFEKNVILDEVQAMIDESALDVDELTASIIAQHDIEVQAMIDANTTSTLATVETMIEESQPDIEKEVLLLYDKYGKALANEIIAQHDITEDVQALIDANAVDTDALTAAILSEVEVMIEDAKEEPIDLEAEVLALYAKYAKALADEIIAQHDITEDVQALIDANAVDTDALTAAILSEVEVMIEDAKEEPIDLEKEVLALYAKYAKALADEIIAQHDITAEVEAMIEDAKEEPIDLEKEVLALYAKYAKALADEIIAQHDITAEVQAMIEDAKEEPIDLEAEVLALYAKYAKALADEIIAQHDITEEVQAMIDESAVDTDALTASILSDVEVMIEDAKEEPIDLEAEVLLLYAKYAKALANEIVAQHDITAEVQAMIDESAVDTEALTASILSDVEVMIEDAKEEPIDLEAEVLLLYDKYAKALANEIISKHVITNEVQAMINASLLDLQNEIVALDEQYGSDNISGLFEKNVILDEVQAMIDASALDVDELTASIIAQHDITEEVQAMIDENAIDLEAEVLALYDKYGKALADEIIAQHDITEEVQAMIDASAVDTEALTASILSDVEVMIEDAKEEPIDIEAEVLALYAKYGKALADEIIAQHDITEDVQALIDANAIDLEKEVLALYDKYGEALASEVIAQHDITEEVQAMIDESALDVEELTASIIEAHDAQLEAVAEEEAVEEETAATVKSSAASKPTFGDAVTSDAGTDEYNEYRNAYKSDAMDSVLAVIGE